MRLLLSPLSWLVLAALLLAAAEWRRATIPRVAGSALLVIALFTMTPVAANWLVGRIEHDATGSRVECADVEWLVLLAGGLDRAPAGEGDGGALTRDSLRRVFALSAHPPPRHWRRAISGGGPHAFAEAEVMDRLLQRLDRRPGAELLETGSRSTWESAKAMAARLPPPRRIALASSALHLPRARRAFEAAGFDVCPWPLDSRFIAVAGATAWLPQSSALRKSEAALHEAAGSVYYRWLAWRESRVSSS